MKKALSVIFGFIKRSDLFLLTLCVISTVGGIVLISSASISMGTNRFVYIQTACLLMGVLLYFLVSIIDVDIFADKWKILFVFSVLLISSLFVFGVAGDTGNRAWLRFGPIGIQPAEVVKIPFIIMLAKQLVHLRTTSRGLNHFFSVIQLVLHVGLFFGLIIISSADLGSALVYLFIFALMLFVGGIKFYWFLAGGAAVALASPFLWNNFLTARQRARILAPYLSSVDPTGMDTAWHANQSKIAIASGQFTGQGLYQGTQTQSGAIPQQHTDFIFSVAGEEFGLIGCAVVTALLVLIIIRCVYVGIKSNSQLDMLVCLGIASMLIFQTFENIGMCIGLTPVIGLTLPFFSYGGSSIITMFVAMGIVSGIKMRPSPVRRFSR